ncbi:vWA domain-containing protein [Acidicapsa ligni]|uniref:vWA domain-containing protein n=1 Tax=Acidicapsa ligni TaxID=542300 RepID=UPI0021E0F5D7|nr:VWA domain-containing protein [Acidicapsa ligni]
MKRTSYTRYNGDLADDIDLENLMQQLSDYLLDSGFENPMMRFQELNGEQSLDNLREAIRQALENGDFDEQLRDKLAQASEEDALEELIDKLIQRMEQQDYVRIDDPNQQNDPSRPSGNAGQVGEGESEARFEVTDKSLDFLGYKALQDLLGSMGRASGGRHDTPYQATGVETNGSSRPYEFGDTLNLDSTATLAAAIAAQSEALLPGESLTLPIEIDYPHLHVQQCDYQSSCATVVMLDCSHSMILYGEDRFTPAKRVAMALSHLIRTQYPGDTLSLVLFHDSAEEVPISQIARVKVGPHYTNTREGLRLSRSILNRQRKEMRQIVMITDGKPSALTLPDGRIYKNSFGLDPLVLSETLEEVARCRRAGILINTFMLATDPGLVQFVQRVSAMCRGKAYFTTPDTLGSYLMMDFLNRKMKTVN